MLNELELAFFLRQLHYLLSGGISLYPAIELVYEDVSSKNIRHRIKKILLSLKEGNTFSEVLKQEIGVSDLVANIIKVGEHNADLLGSLKRAYEHLEKKVSLSRKIKTALSYPILVFSLAFFMVIWLNIKVIPNFIQIYAENSVILPWSTRFLFSLHNFLSHYWWLLIVSIFLLGIIFLVAMGSRAKFFLSKFVFVLPGVGTYYYYMSLMTFLSDLSSLHMSGMSLIYSLKLAVSNTRNFYLKTRLEEVYQDIIEGAELSVAIEKINFFPNVVIKMMAVAEETAMLNEVLLQLTDYLSDELDMHLKRFIQMIGPVSLIILGVIIAFISVAFLLPVFKMPYAIRHYA